MECRCAIGRAYYAAFLVAREFLESLDIVVPNGGACHTAVQRGLNNSGVATLAVIAAQLSKLYTGRADSDYEMRIGAVETAADARASVDLARTLITMVDVILAGGLNPPLDRVRTARTILDYARQNAQPLFRKP